MSLDIAEANVNRNITLAGTSVAIFTFLLFFLYPRYVSGEINIVLFQFTLAIIVSVIFSLVISALYYYGTTLSLSLTPGQVTTIFGKAEAFWLIGYSLLLRATFRVAGVDASKNASSQARATSIENASFASGVAPISPVASSICQSNVCL